MPASIAQSSLRILQEHLLDAPALSIPESVRKERKHVSFSFDRESFFPTPYKLSESITSLWTLVVLLASAISRQRYATDVDSITVDIPQATLMVMSAFLFKINNRGIWDPSVQKRTAPLDLGKIQEPYRAFATNIYQTKDGRWFHLHGGLDTTKTLFMLGLTQHRPDLSSPDSGIEIKKIYSKAVSQHNSKWLDLEVNEHWRQAGTICYTEDEFLATPQGVAMKDEPLYSVEKRSPRIPSTPWPSQLDSRRRPLSGIKVIDISRVVAGPTISKVLALLGADVIRISSPTLPEPSVLVYDTNLGKRDVSINLKTCHGKSTLRNLMMGADVVVDGFRPGSLARMGFSQAIIEEIANERQRGIVYCRENCYGWKGELAHRSGWQQISDCLTGISWAQGLFHGLNEAVVPLVPNSDYQTGVVGAVAICQALLRRAVEGGSYDVKTSLTQYNMWYSSLGKHDSEVQQHLRDLHPNLTVRHDTLLSEMTARTAASIQEMAEREGDKDFFRPDRWAEHGNRWGVEGELGQFLDWSQIVKFQMRNSADAIKLGYDHGSCYPGSDKAAW
ncbi:CAIB/BAIF family enzyme [Dactylonectria macrodidyma]|uniref:CAIB/BAIF family enzyme n=1 Tax=Dactylonectria macrodidyma TaxID=307937 RepID=A0A9P9DYF0_9HYPO|nr:CAIB/BAIF family enzyme [Dactylonectria macrodidyma]